MTRRKNYRIAKLSWTPAKIGTRALTDLDAFKSRRHGGIWRTWNNAWHSDMEFKFEFNGQTFRGYPINKENYDVLVMMYKDNLKKKLFGLQAFNVRLYHLSKPLSSMKRKR